MSNASPRTFDPLGAIPAGTVLLEASAGTGKTYSIASLVLRLVGDEGVPVDRVLVVTFTEAATAELRARLRARLRDAHRLVAHASAGRAGRPEGLEPDAVAAWVVERARAGGALGIAEARLRAAVERFDEAPVSTIHGFCQRMLREHALACGADADAELLADQSPLVGEVVRDFWACETARRSDAAVRALVQHAGLSLGALHALARAALADGDAQCVPAAEVETVALDDVAGAHAGQRATFAAFCREDDGRHVSDACEQIDAARARKALDARSWKEGAAEKHALELARWAETGCAGLAPEKLAALSAGGLRAKTNKKQEPPAHALFDAVERLCVADARLAAAAGAEALRVKHTCVAHVRAEVARRKRARGLVGYDDLLRHVRDALRAPGGAALGRTLCARYDAVLVDEFQDTDAVQWEVFRRAFADRGHRLFLIGDPKQSIYRFRGADVHAYLDARAAAGDAVFALGTNRRSDGPLVDALEGAFGGHAAPFAGGGIGWRAVEAHHAGPRCGARDAGTPLGPPLAVRYVPNEATPKPMSKARLRALLPDLVAADVVRFLDRAELDDTPNGGRRRARPSDAAVLVNTHAQGAAVQEALRRARVPAVGRTTASVFASDEARDLAVVLGAVLDPRGTHLRAALATDLLGIAAAEEHAPDQGLGPGDVVAILCTADGADGDGGQDTAAELLDRWSERMRTWREQWRGAGGGARRGTPNVMRVVRAITDELQLPARLLALYGGERRLTNLRHVAELTHAAAVAGALGPDASLAWLRHEVARAREAGGRCDDEHQQQRVETDADAVQVVTVHASKGLEYGAVWVPYLWDGPSDRRTPAHPCVHGLVSPAASGGDARPARALDLAPGGKGAESIELDADEAFAERLRQAYVALTRARHRVTVWWAGATDCEKSPLGWLLYGGGAESPRAARAALADAFQNADDAALWAQLRAWGDAAGAQVAVVREDGGDTPALPWRRGDAIDDVAPVDPPTYRGPAALDGDGWRLGSFTGLTRGMAHHRAPSPPAPEAAELPESLGDARAADPAADPGVTADAEVALADFPASAAAGVCFHEILERHDFTDDAGLDARIRGGLRAHGFDGARWAGAVAGALRATLGAGVVDPGDSARAPLRLDRVPLTRRLTELRFELPACDGGLGAVDPAALAAAFAAHPGGALDAARMPAYATSLGALDFRPLRGFLTGVLDVLVEQHGRWWVVDWKSNRLGRHRADYAPAAVLAEMTGAHYVLQYHLYVLAAHRWLRLRVPDYDYDRHVAGACYLFLRGITPGAAGRDAVAERGAPAGVFADRPPRARVDALDRLFLEGRA